MGVRSRLARLEAAPRVNHLATLSDGQLTERIRYHLCRMAERGALVSIDASLRQLAQNYDVAPLAGETTTDLWSRLKIVLDAKIERGAID